MPILQYLKRRKCSRKDNRSRISGCQTTPMVFSGIYMYIDISTHIQILPSLTIEILFHGIDDCKSEIALSFLGNYGFVLCLG